MKKPAFIEVADFLTDFYHFIPEIDIFKKAMLEVEEGYGDGEIMYLEKVQDVVARLEGIEATFREFADAIAARCDVIVEESLYDEEE